MSTSYQLPGAGFVLLVSVVVAGGAFLAWGLTTPPLERVWHMQLELMLGTRDALSSRDFRLLQDTLARYPELADNMLDDAPDGLVSAATGGMVDTGYAYLVRKNSAAPGVLVVTSPNGKKLTLRGRTSAAASAGEAREDTPFVWALPNDGPFPQLIEVRDEADRKKPRPMRVELRATP
ncbi:MAG: hypothetical protein HYZ27_12445 [Deltaproteobacteria bacterium]|nr:hypothetical protein [Deltaproteobacteria bacterium]